LRWTGGLGHAAEETMVEPRMRLHQDRVASRRRDASSWLNINWTESGMSGRQLGSSRQGFGTVLLELRLPYDVGARVARSFEPSGLAVRSGCLRMTR